jgi:Flp pilus assembly protein TadD
LALQGKQSEAAAQYREAIHLVPRNDVFHLNLGLSLLKSGRPDEAVDEFAAAALLNPRSPDAQYELGYCLAMLRRPEIAVAHLREAVRLRPDWAEPLNALAWVLATDSNAQIRDGAEAVRLAEKAVALSQGRQPVVLNTLAAAFAEAGRFDDATNAAANAAELARQSGRINLAAQIQSALELYQQHRAYRQP